MSPPRRAIITITSAHAPLFEGTHTTGAFVTEVLHPYKVLTAAGFDVDITSEKGTYTPDWLSLTPDFLSGDDLAIWNDTSSPSMKIAATVWDNGGIVSSVCHGPAVFHDLVDTATGEPLIKGKTITGFTTEAETVMHLQDELKSWKTPLVEETAEAMGAIYKRSSGVWDDYHVVDGQLVTGQNPASATSTAKAVVDAFEKL
ncbi:class I glutamine amidotransferase-like protein [Cercophora newfieldiana]|uniref:D-lactate dehydratase n=1 Tax=Cercophora newfieldiana TaxID=92897 RepID=A0AA40CY44_9PEZI|nr:class I glutamine amidotransferase-like protein [Cercophora newfieldiana]